MPACNLDPSHITPLQPLGVLAPLREPLPLITLFLFQTCPNLRGGLRGCIKVWWGQEDPRVKKLDDLMPINVTVTHSGKMVLPEFVIFFKKTTAMGDPKPLSTKKFKNKIRDGIGDGRRNVFVYTS